MKLKRNTIYGMTGVLSALMIGFIISVTTQGTKKIEIGFDLSTFDNPFFKTMGEGAEKKAEELGVKVIITDSNDDSNKQLSNIDSMIAMNVNGLIINPVNSSTIGTSIKKSNNLNIPVITVDRGSEDGEVLTHIASDNVQGAYDATTILVEQLELDGVIDINIGELTGVSGASATIDRGKGFNNAVKDSNATVAKSELANFNRAEAFEVINSWETAGDLSDMDAIFAHNDEMALGAYKALTNHKLERQIKVVGFDAIDEAKESINKNEMFATVEQNPFWMGEKAVEVMVEKIKNGINPNKKIPSPTNVIHNGSVPPLLNVYEFNKNYLDWMFVSSTKTKYS